ESASPEDIAAAVEVLSASGAVEAVEIQIHDYAQQAREALDALAMDGLHRSRLEGLIEATVSRTA
ncbi:MAG TPA: polyprenyl synthetase family protein, partial [Demequina sp.]|nr:polyprenyl synthetase family protein [Demequina sp.]